MACGSVTTLTRTMIGEAMELRDLTAEQQEKIQRAKDPQELLALLMEEGIELADDDLEKVSGGWDDSDSSGPTCPVCGSVNGQSNPSAAPDRLRARITSATTAATSGLQCRRFAPHRVFRLRLPFGRHFFVRTTNLCLSRQIFAIICLERQRLLLGDA